MPKLDPLQWTCLVAGTTQMALLLYLFFSVRIETHWYYVSDALLTMTYVRVLLTITVLIQTLIAMIFVTSWGMAWAASCIVCGTGVAFGWIILVTWNETTSPHLYGVGLFLVSLGFFFTLEIVRRGISLFDTASSSSETTGRNKTKTKIQQQPSITTKKSVWVACVVMFVTLLGTITTFITMEWGTQDPTLYEWISFMLGEILFMLVTVTLEY